MKKLPLHEEKIKRAIRDAVVVDPLISVARLQDALFEKGFKTPNNTPLDWDYVARLRKKIHRQAIENVNRQETSERVAELKEKNRIVFDRLVRIAYYTDDMKKEGMQPPSYKDVIAALTAMVRLDLMIFNAELDAGIFERHIGTLEVEKRYKPLPPELKAQMMLAFKNWGIIPPDQHEQTQDHGATEYKPNSNTTTAIVVARQ